DQGDNPMKLPLLMTILLFSSCSNINTSSQDYYNLTRSLRHGVVPMDAPSEVTKVRLDSTAAASGKVLFQKHCASCHGVDGKGEGAEGKKHFPAPVDLTKLAKEIPNFKLFIKI